MIALGTYCRKSREVLRSRNSSWRMLIRLAIGRTSTVRYFVLASTYLTCFMLDIVTQVDTNELFTIWVQGQSPNAKRDSHEVIVVPAVSFVDFPSKRDAALVNIEVLFNSEDVQAVRHKALNIISSTFYKPGKLSTDQLSLTVNIPCIVMVVFTSAGIKLHVSDPTQSAAKITLTVQDDLICAGCTSQNDQTSVTVDLPRGDIKGSSISVLMQK
jgi:hypothetical protein